jgi:hypothetical protein
MEYLLDVSDQAGISRVYTHLSSISYNYRRLGKVSPCDDIRMKMFMKGLKRDARDQPVRRALPLTVDILEKAVRLLTESDTLIAWRTVWRIVISFSCFLRWDDTSRLKVILKTLKCLLAYD